MKGGAQVATPYLESRVIIKSMMVIVIIGAMGLVVDSVYKKRRVSIEITQTALAYVNEVEAFVTLTDRLSSAPPVGVDRRLWEHCVLILFEEPLVHPLRVRHGKDDDHSDLSYLSELVLKRDSLRQVNEYLVQQLSATPITLRSLTDAHDLIEQDYDTERLTKSSSAIKHPEDCKSKFNKCISDMSNHM